jgi:hypothetical protein
LIKLDRGILLSEMKDDTKDFCTLNQELFYASKNTSNLVILSKIPEIYLIANPEQNI